jgi:hypothetical protein
MKQLITETKTRIVEYASGGAAYAESQDLISSTGRTILTNPKFLNSGSIVLPANATEFTIVRAYAASFVNIISRDSSPVFVKLLLDDDFNSGNVETVDVAVALHTNIFMYANPKLPVIIALANGNLDVDPITGHLLPTLGAKEQTVEFVLAAHNLEFSDTDFSAFSSVSGNSF